jgi:hypothetical protein
VIELRKVTPIITIILSLYCNNLNNGKSSFKLRVVSISDSIATRYTANMEKKFADGYVIWQSDFDTNGGKYAETIDYKI